MAGNTLGPGQRLLPGEKLVNGKYELVYQADGNLVVYEAGGRVAWSCNKHGNPAGDARVIDGNLYLYPPSGAYYWRTNLVSRPDVKLVLEADGNLILSQDDGAIVWASNSWTPTFVQNLHFKRLKRLISFAKNGHPLDYHSLADNRWQHLQDMLRLPDANGRRYYMGTYSQNCSATEGGMVFVAELENGKDEGKVIWSDVLSNSHKAGGYNHPGDLRRIGNTVVVAGQNWAGTDLSDAAVELGGDPMHRGAGNKQNVLFYDVTDPARPKYVGAVNGYAYEFVRKSVSGEIDTVTASRSGEYYYLAFHGKNGFKLRSRTFLPDAQWDLVEEAKDNGSSPIFFRHSGKILPGGARRDGARVVYDELVFGDGGELLPTTRQTTRVDRLATPILDHAFVKGSPFSLSVLPNGKSYVVYTNVESDSRIEIEEIESEDAGPITGLYVLFGRTAAVPPGYTKIAVDLNREAGGDYIYLCYTRDPAAGAPITGLQVMEGDHLNPPPGYEFTPNNLGGGNRGDLNRRAGGATLFLCVCRHASLGAAVQAVDITIGQSSQPHLGWERLPVDLNKGAGGNFIYLIYSRN